MHTLRWNAQLVEMRIRSTCSVQAPGGDWSTLGFRKRDGWPYLRGSGETRKSKKHPTFFPPNSAVMLIFRTNRNIYTKNRALWPTFLNCWFMLEIKTWESSNSNPWNTRTDSLKTTQNIPRVPRCWTSEQTPKTPHNFRYPYICGLLRLLR